MASRRSTEQIRQLIDAYGASGLTRREFCERHRIPVTTLDYWRRSQPRKPRLVEVEVAATETPQGFTLILANGRRIESSWRFADAELARLIQLVETA
jgi:hypothetical protein